MDEETIDVLGFEGLLLNEVHTVTQEVAQHVGTDREDTSAACGRVPPIEHLDGRVQFAAGFFDFILLAFLELRLLHRGPIELKAVHQELMGLWLVVMEDGDLETPWRSWPLVSGSYVHRPWDCALDKDIVGRLVHPWSPLELALYVVDPEKP